MTAHSLDGIMYDRISRSHDPACSRRLGGKTGQEPGARYGLQPHRRSKIPMAFDLDRDGENAFDRAYDA